jgi:plastocyanin
MPFTWQITINKTTGSGFAYEPSTLTGVAVNDQIIWTNNDDKPHWPGITGNDTYFMPNQIQPDNSSDTFLPGVTGTISYVDSLHPAAPGGKIVVS